MFSKWRLINFTIFLLGFIFYFNFFGCRASPTKSTYGSEHYSQEQNSSRVKKIGIIFYGEEADTISNAVIQKIASTNCYEALSRESIDQILTELNLKSSSKLSLDNIMEIYKKSQADEILIGEIQIDEIISQHKTKIKEELFTKIIYIKLKSRLYSPTNLEIRTDIPIIEAYSSSTGKNPNISRENLMSQCAENIASQMVNYLYLYRNGKLPPSIEETRREDTQVQEKLKPPVMRESKVRNVIVEREIANIRSGPDTNYEKIGSAKKGERLKVEGEANGWFCVRLSKDKIGWIYGGLVSEYRETDNIGGEKLLPEPVSTPKEPLPTPEPVSTPKEPLPTPEPKPAETATPTPEHTPVIEKTEGIIAEEINIKSKPSVFAPVIASAPAGSYIKILNYQENWAEVQYKDIIGFVLKTDIKFNQ